MEQRTYKLGDWIKGIFERYENWLLALGRIEEAFYVHKCYEEMAQHYFYDYHCAPFEVRVACKYMWRDAALTLLMGLGYPNLFGKSTMP